MFLRWLFGGEGYKNVQEFVEEKAKKIFGDTIEAVEIYNAKGQPIYRSRENELKTPYLIAVFNDAIKKLERIKKVPQGIILPYEEKYGVKRYIIVMPFTVDKNVLFLVVSVSNEYVIFFNPDAELKKCKKFVKEFTDFLGKIHKKER
ncbi:hypothetical protein [Desulfurobacterium sp.]|uniref:hypothetical protein n=1 Tax=Desulfurobacterium sp. TaxID=2004706 RepID=UPI00261DA3E3|nr:hypothetical protein [Desulfurobacterium sp.]